MSLFNWLTLIINNRLGIIEESQPVKSRNLSRLIANLSRQNWSSERNSLSRQNWSSERNSEISQQANSKSQPAKLVKWTAARSTKYLSTPEYCWFSFWVHQYVSDLHSTAANWPETFWHGCIRNVLTLLRHSPIASTVSVWHCCIHRIRLYNGICVVFWLAHRLGLRCFIYLFI